MLRMYGDLSSQYADDIMQMAKDDSRSVVEVRRRASQAEMVAVVAGAAVSVLLPILGLVLGFIALLMGEMGAALLAFIAPGLASVAKIIEASRRGDD